MKFIHLTDTHIRKAYNAGGLDAMLEKLESAQGLEKILDRISWDDVDFAVITGDLVHEGNAEDYAYFNEILKTKVPVGIPVFPVLGNHDEKAAFYAGMLNEQIHKPYYYKEYMGDYRLIMLDSAVPGKESGYVIEEELEWLKEVLREPYGKGTVVFLHHPLVWSADGGGTMVAKNAGAVLDILEKSDVFAVFCGHTHQNSTELSNGIFQSTSDSAAFSLEIRGDELAFTKKSGYCIVQVNDQSVSVHHEISDTYDAVLSMSLESFADALKKMDDEEQQ